MLALVAGVLVATPAQAHPIYKRAFVNFRANECMWAPDGGRNGTISYLDSCGLSPNTAAKWKLHVVDDSYGSSGHEVWVLESVQYPGSCFRAFAQGASGTIGTCDWADGTHGNTFEAFYHAPTGDATKGVYQMKSIWAWEQTGSGHDDICISADDITGGIIMAECNLNTWDNWYVSAAA